MVSATGTRRRAEIAPEGTDAAAGPGDAAPPPDASTAGNVDENGAAAPLLTRPLLALLVAGLTFLLVVLAGEWSHQKAVTSLESLRKRADAGTGIQGLVRNVLEAESAQRGYLLTGSPAYLEPMEKARAAIAPALQSLHGHYDVDPELGRRLQALEKVVTEKLAEVDETLRLYRQGSHESWQSLMATDFGRERMEQLRSAATGLLTLENDRVALERSEVYRTLSLGRAAVVGAMLVAALWFVFYVRRNTARQAQQRAQALALRAQRDALEAEVKARTAELSQLNRYLQDVREVERGRLARILHDELGSLLTAAKLDLTRLRRAMSGGAEAATPRLDHLATTIDEGIVLKRRIIEELMPSALVNLGLVPALEVLCADVERRSGLKISVEIEDVALDDATRIALYRVVEAALSNVEAHAGARTALVRVAQTGRRIAATVRDDGCGFDSSVHSGPTHQLTVLRHRVEALHGRLRVRSGSGEGTEVQAQFPAPLRSDDDGADAAAAAAAVAKARDTDRGTVQGAP